MDDSIQILLVFAWWLYLFTAFMLQLSVLARFYLIQYASALIFCCNVCIVVRIGLYFVCWLLHKIFGSRDDGQSCAICLENLDWDTRKQSLACGHRFHTRCIHRWLSDKKTCPCCRAAVL